MKKILFSILCLMLASCLLSCNQEFAYTSAPTDDDKIFTESYRDTSPKSTDKPIEEYPDFYYALYGRLSKGDLYTEAVSLVGSEGKRLSTTDETRLEWDLGDGRFLQVTVDRNNLEKAGIVNRVILIANKKEQPSEIQTDSPENMLSQEEKEAVINAANSAMKQKYPSLDLERFEISVKKYDKKFSVRYDMFVDGIRTSERYLVDVNNDLSISSIFDIDPGDFSSINIDKDSLGQALEDLLMQTEKYNSNAPYLRIHKGQPCLYQEVILNVLYPHEAGTFPSDHIHLYFAVPLSYTE